MVVYASAKVTHCSLEHRGTGPKPVLHLYRAVGMPPYHGAPALLSAPLRIVARSIVIAAVLTAFFGRDRKICRFQNQTQRSERDCTVAVYQR